MRAENKSSNIITTLLPQTHIMNGDVFYINFSKTGPSPCPYFLKKQKARIIDVCLSKQYTFQVFYLVLEFKGLNTVSLSTPICHFWTYAQGTSNYIVLY